MIYVTGDTHRDFSCIQRFCKRFKTTTDDVIIVLGDAGINLFGDARDSALKAWLATLPITLFCVHGNHERRPSKELGYDLLDYRGDLAYVQQEFPNIVFAKDGAVYDFDGRPCLVCGGAYSVDKQYRLSNGYHWFSDEQPDDETKARVEDRLTSLDHKIDIILSHTCPLKYVPCETFLQGVRQADVDISTEKWLDQIEDTTTYDEWYCGHYHINKVVDKVQFLYDSFRPIFPQDMLSDGKE